MKLKNNTYIEGRLYDHKLAAKVTGETSKHPGTPFIQGTINIATDDACTNIVSIHFSYVAPTYSSGKENRNYKILKDVIDGKLKTVMDSDKDHALLLRVTGSLGLSESYDENEELRSYRENEGIFINILSALSTDEKSRNVFECDTLITNVRRVEADEEKGLPEKVIVKGAIFGYKDALLPYEFAVLNPYAMNYFESLEASNKNPVFTLLRGSQISQTVVKTFVEASAFNEDYVREVSSIRRDFVITWAAKEPHEWDTEETMTAAHLTELIAERETYLAGVKQRSANYRASLQNKTVTPEVPAKGAFNF